MRIARLVLFVLILAPFSVSAESVYHESDAQHEFWNRCGAIWDDCERIKHEEGLEGTDEGYELFMNCVQNHDASCVEQPEPEPVQYHDMHPEEKCYEIEMFCKEQNRNEEEFWGCVEQHQIELGVKCLPHVGGESMPHEDEEPWVEEWYEDDGEEIYPDEYKHEDYNDWETQEPVFDWVEEEHHEEDEWEHEFAHDCPGDVVSYVEERCSVISEIGEGMEAMERCMQKLLERKTEMGMCGDRGHGGGDGSGPDHSKGCRPFGGDNKLMLEKWVHKVREEHGVEISLDEAMGFPVCEGDVHLPPPLQYHDLERQGYMGPPVHVGPDVHWEEGPPMAGGDSALPGGYGHRVQGEETFERAMNELKALSGRPDISDDLRARVFDAMRWMVDQLEGVASGSVSPQEFAREAAARIEDIFREAGDMHYGGDEMHHEFNPEEHLMRMLGEIDEIIRMIPEAMEMMLSMGHEVPGWEEFYEDLANWAPQIRDVCEGASETGVFKTCKNELHEFFEAMHKMEKHVEEYVDREVMDRVGEEMGMMDDHDGDHGEDMYQYPHDAPYQGGSSMPGDYYPGMPGPDGMHYTDHLPPGFDPAGVQVPAVWEQEGSDCLSEGYSPEECHQKLMEKMLEQFLLCMSDGALEEECTGHLQEGFMLPGGMPDPAGAVY